MKMYECATGFLVSLFFVMSSVAIADSPGIGGDTYGPVGPEPRISAIGSLSYTDPMFSHDRSYYDTYSVYLQQGQTYRIWMGSYYFRPYILVQHAQSPMNPSIFIVQVEGYDQGLYTSYGPVTGGEGRRAYIASIQFTAPYNGYYRLIANSMESSITGDYRISVR